MKCQLLNLKNLKGQSAIEFVILVTAVLFLFVGFLYFIQSKLSDSQYEAISEGVNEVALAIQDEINLAQNSADGYFRDFFIPLKINGLDYHVEILENSIFVRTDDERHSVALPVTNVTGDVFIGSNSIYKTNGSVFLN
ncbi:MAG: hypothetical protein AABW89_00735 [Nanoarchaeota archaeon]